LLDDLLWAIEIYNELPDKSLNPSFAG